MKVPSSELDEFFRFFRISGMFHCNSGPGAWVIGQGGGAAAAGVPFEFTNNVLAALVKWVEDGVAPETIEGTKFVNDTVAMGVAFRRRHCRSGNYRYNNLIYANGIIDTPYEIFMSAEIIICQAAGNAWECESDDLGISIASIGWHHEK